MSATINPRNSMKAVRWGPRATLADVPALREMISQDVEVVDIGGTTHLNLLVYDRTPYVIRVYRPWVLRQRILCLRNMRLLLAKSGLCVPEPIKVRHQEVFKLSGLWAEAESYLPHQPASVRQYPQVFAALGELHRAMSTCWLGTLPEPLLPNYGTVAQLKAWLLESTRRLGTHTDTEEAIRRVGEAIQTLGRLEQAYAMSLPQVPVHGDYTLANVGFTDSEEPVYFDFDIASVRPRVHELAYAALVMLRYMECPVNPALPTWDVVWHMLGEYERAAQQPLSTLERSAILLEMVRVSLRFAARAGFPEAREESWPELLTGLGEAESLLRAVMKGIAR